MDEDLIALGVVLFLFAALPFTIVTAITGSVAHSRTKAWAKVRRHGLEGENRRLVASPDADSESDFYDTDDEAEHNQRKAEEEADAFLTFNQKWKKEFRGVWSGKGRDVGMKKKEREERRKLAKAVVREMARVERRQVGRDVKGGEAGDLPPYKKG